MDDSADTSLSSGGDNRGNVEAGGISTGSSSAALQTEIAADSSDGAPASRETSGGNPQSSIELPSLTVPPPSNGTPSIDFEHVPSLRGMLFPGEMGASIKGLWAMMDSQHGQPGMTSEFELHFVQGIGKMTMDAVELLSGKYRGWFRLKRLNGNGTDKVEEKNVILNFNKMEESGDYSIKGEGSNRFGGFVLQGTLGRDNSVIMYRQYVVKVGTTPKGTTPKAFGAPKASTGTKNAAVPKSAFKAVTDSPRASAGTRPKAVRPASISASRSQRLSQHLLRCLELLKEMRKLPASVYFLEPVDYVKLNIPDYPTLITTPMDFSTVATKLSAGEYAGPANFAEDVRLVFKNAITYNQASDNPVHMAAREMSVKFEEKFKALHHSMTSKQSVSAAELAAFTSRNNRPPQPAKAKPKSSGGTRKPTGGGSANNASMFMVPPDGSMIQMQEMHRKMMDMQNELESLRAKMGRDTVAPEAKKSLTMAEKKSLIDSINALPEEHMERIVAIVQEAQPLGTVEDEEVEVPLDELDTSTLRKLQAVVNEVEAELNPQSARKRGADSHPASGRPQRQPPSKRSRTGADSSVFSQSATALPPEDAPVLPTAPLLSATNVLVKPVVPAAVEMPPADYAEVFAGAAQAVKVDTVAAPADAWATVGASTGTAASTVGDLREDSSWNEASSEMQARQQREQERRQREERLQQQREQEDQQRADSMRAAAEEQAERRRQEEQDAREAAARQEAQMQALREDERRRREQTSAVTVDSADVLKQMESNDL